MSDRMHSWGRRLLLLLRADEGLVVRNAVLLLGSYALCALGNKLLHVVKELSRHKEGAVDLSNDEANQSIAKITLVLIASSAPLLEELLLLLPGWVSRLIFTLLVFAGSHFLIEGLKANYTSPSDTWIYLQAALAWAAAAGTYLLGPASFLQPQRGAKIRYVAYVSLGALGLIV